MIFPQRKKLRLEGYDYSQRGLYFVTICINHRKNLFGSIHNGVLTLNPAGEMSIRWYLELQNKYPNVKCLEYVAMPNHFHCVIHITEQLDNTLDDIMQWYKTMTTNEYIRGVKELGWQRFDGKLWQKSYIDRIIKSQDMYWTIADYINNNPINWKEDRFFVE